jgi:hypothetical protein
LWSLLVVVLMLCLLLVSTDFEREELMLML